MAFVSWDHTFLLRRRGQGTSFDQPAQALDEVVDRGYNAIRLDPLPQWVDIDRPDEVLSWPDPHSPYIPWCLNSAISRPVGRWLLDYVKALHSRPLNYTLSAWWFGHDGIGPAARLPANHLDAAEIWADALHRWASRFDLDRILYVDLANEVPYFIPALTSRLAQRMGADWHASSRWSAEQIDVLVEEMNPAISALQREFPHLRFTYSIHGDPRWLDVPLNVDCLDVHFFADIDSRWADRVQFSETMPAFNTGRDWMPEFGRRCEQAWRSMGPMLRSRQRTLMAAFADWSARIGAPLTVTEGWSSWEYFDDPALDWQWLLEWSEQALEDAVDLGFWGWTPHNYTQPQFAFWQDTGWHRNLTSRFLTG